jgi:hypothetical protein
VRKISGKKLKTKEKAISHGDVAPPKSPQPSEPFAAV